MEASGLHMPHGLVSAARARPESWAAQLRWYAAAVLVGFAVPFIGSSVLELQHDVYLGIYLVVVLAGFAGYAVATALDVRATLHRHWRLGVALGIVVGFALVRNVLSEESTPRPHGTYYVFELIWRGGIYGAVDAVLPCLVVYRGLGGDLATWRRRIAYFASSLALVMIITASYHLGYARYRDAGVGAPETGNTLISMPMLLSTNPIGSVADHMAMHISAVTHTYETDTRLPPQTTAR